MCRSRDLIGNCIGAERGDYTWNGKRFCDLHVDSIRSLLVSLNAIKRTQLLTEHNNYDSELEEYLALLEKLYQNLATSLLMYFVIFIIHSSARCSCRKR